VAEKDGQVVGFVTVGKSRDDDADKALEGEIYAFYVDPNVWRQGYGRALSRQALESLRAQGFSEVTLWVLRDNRRAISFYQAMGFQADGGVKTEMWRNEIDIHQSRFRRSHLRDCR
jgi:ribosomal protein S18 acetylase RimI-like enzyme